MNKKAQMAELVGVIAILLISVFGTIGVYSQKATNYVGDSSTMLLYKYPDCTSNIGRIPKEHSVEYDNLVQAENDGYTPVNCQCYLAIHLFYSSPVIGEALK